MNFFFNSQDEIKRSVVTSIKLIFYIIQVLFCFSRSNAQSVTGLSDLVKSYGFVKYFYPDKNLRDFNWEYFIETQKANFEHEGSVVDRAERLRKAFNSVAPLVRFTNDTSRVIAGECKGSRAFRIYHIGFGESFIRLNNRIDQFLLNKFLIPTKTVFEKVQVNRQGIREYRSFPIDSGLYIQLPVYLFREEFSTVKRAKKEDKDCSAYVDVAIIWNIYNHFFPYFSSDRRQKFEQNLNEYIKGSLVANSIKDRYILLMHISAFLNDGHSRVYPPVNVGLYYNPDFAINSIQDRIYVTRIGEEIRQNIKMRDEIIEINGKSIKSFIDSIYLYNSIPSYSYLKSRINLILSGEKGSILHLKIRRNDEIIETNIERIQFKNFVNPPKDPVRMLEDSIFYINLNSCTKKDIKKYRTLIQKSKGLVVDLRGYPNFLSTKFLYNFFETSVLDTISFYYPIFNSPNGKFQREQYSEIIKINPPKQKLSSNVVFLTNGAAISKSETWLDIIKQYRLGTIIGSSSAGTNGDMGSFMLKSGFEISFTSGVAIKYDGTYFMNNPILPDISIEPSINDICEGADTVLNYSIKFLKNGRNFNNSNK